MGWKDIPVNETSESVVQFTAGLGHGSRQDQNALLQVWNFTFFLD